MDNEFPRFSEGAILEYKCPHCSEKILFEAVSFPNPGDTTKHNCVFCHQVFQLNW